MTLTAREANEIAVRVERLNIVGDVFEQLKKAEYDVDAAINLLKQGMSETGRQVVKTLVKNLKGYASEMTDFISSRGWMPEERVIEAKMHISIIRKKIKMFEHILKEQTK